MKERRRRPGRLWLFFHGRKRRGFPGLIVGLIAAALVLSLAFAIPGGADLIRGLILASALVLGLLLAASLALVVLAWRRPRDRR